MHSDDHILEHFLAGKHPLPALAAHLGMTLIALIQWVDRNADLLATAKRAMEAHLAFLALKAEAAALIDLTSVSSSTTNEERKRKSSSQLLRHSAKRLLTNPTRERGAPCDSATRFVPSLAPTQRARSVSDGPSAHFLTNLAGSLDCSASPSPRLRGEKVPSTEGARGMRRSPSAHSLTNLAGSPDCSASPPSPRTSGEKVPSTEGARGMRGDGSSPPVAASHSNAEPPTPNPASSSFSDHEVDAMMAALAMHFNIDVKSLFTDDDPVPAALAK